MHDKVLFSYATSGVTPEYSYEHFTYNTFKKYIQSFVKIRDIAYKSCSFLTELSCKK